MTHSAIQLIISAYLEAGRCTKAHQQGDQDTVSWRHQLAAYTASRHTVPLPASPVTAGLALGLTQCANLERFTWGGEGP